MRSERKPRGSWGEGGKGSRLSPVPLSVNSLSPVLPSLDVTDRRGTARSLGPQGFLVAVPFLAFILNY